MNTVPSMIEAQLKKLFLHYISAFKCYDLANVKTCYTLPCTLHTPDKIAYLDNEQVFNQEFNDIFLVLKQANTENIIATKATYNINENLTVDVCIDWAFIDNKGEVFADFTAFYHLINLDDTFKIISVVSHQIENSLELSHVLNITE